MQWNSKAQSITLALQVLTQLWEAPNVTICTLVPAALMLGKTKVDRLKHKQEGLLLFTVS